MKYMMITNNTEIASAATEAGVDRIFVDLEINGKVLRQGHLNTVISNHSINDVEKIKKSISKGELLVRINPYYDGTLEEVEEVIKAGADLIMLPMFTTSDEVEKLSNLINGRAGIIPLVETTQAMVRLKDIVKIKGLTEIYIGLNDLHLGLGLDFMFEPLAYGLVDNMTAVIKEAGLPFGFGGIARLDDGLLSSRLVLAEHQRLGSSSVILSRTFSKGMELKLKRDYMDKLSKEINILREEEIKLSNRSEYEIKANKEKVAQLVTEIAQNTRNKNRLVAL